MSNNFIRFLDELGQNKTILFLKNEKNRGLCLKNQADGQPGYKIASTF